MDSFVVYSGEYSYMKKWLILLIFCALLGSVYAQSYYPDKVDKKTAALYAQAISAAEAGNFKDGINFLDKAIQQDTKFVDAYLSRAGMYGELKDYKAAIQNYETAFGLDSAYSNDYKLPYSINLCGNGDFEKALDAVNSFLTNPKLNDVSVKSGLYRKKTYEFAIDYKKTHANAYLFEPKNMGDSINTVDGEYYPSLTIDGKTLIFTRRLKGFNEDFFESHFENGVWRKGKPLQGDINTPQNEGAQNISQDGQWLVFTGCNFEGGMGSCDLYFSVLTRRGWSEPQNLGNNINSEFWESAPCFSPDKRDLYFASRMPGGVGGTDIWVSHRLPSGRWAEPENLGPTINTKGDESCPFVHADNQTLYFTSNGHPGYGGDDLFVSRRKPDGSWGKPENLGYPINTVENEGSLVIAADGRTTYYASDRADSRGALDLYTFQIRDDLRPFKTLWVKGRVFDKNTKAGLPSAVELIDLGTAQTISKVQTDEEGNYLITLPIGKDYAFNVNRKGYLFYSENFPLSQKDPDSTYQIDIPLQPIVANASIVLKNIFYETNKFELRPESQVELNKIVQLLQDNPNLKILISGHTDNVGKDTDNLTLSNNRAKTVTTYLAAKGINQARLQAKGFGSTKPVADNKTDEGRAQNRRTELSVTSN